MWTEIFLDVFDQHIQNINASPNYTKFAISQTHELAFLNLNETCKLYDFFIFNLKQHPTSESPNIWVR